MRREEMSDEVRPAYEDAVRLSEDPRLRRLFAELALDEDGFAKAMDSAAETLAGAGIDVPASLSVVFGRPGIGHPVPGDQEFPFGIVFSNCRTFWLTDLDRFPPVIKQTEEVCFTVTIVPSAPPGGPVGRGGS
jgi:hypothetical protein